MIKDKNLKNLQKVKFIAPIIFNLEINANLSSNFLRNNNVNQISKVIGDADWEVGAPILYLNGDGKYSTHGLAILKKLDSSHGGKFSSSDAKWNDLKVWVDANSDGVTDTGELKTLIEAGVKEINLSAITQANKERNEGNIIFAKTTYTTTDGHVKQVAAVDFTTNTIGYEFNDGRLNSDKIFGGVYSFELTTKYLTIKFQYPF